MTVCLAPGKVLNGTQTPRELPPCLFRHDVQTDADCPLMQSATFGQVYAYHISYIISFDWASGQLFFVVYTFSARIDTVFAQHSCSISGHCKTFA